MHYDAIYQHYNKKEKEQQQQQQQQHTTTTATTTTANQRGSGTPGASPMCEALEFDEDWPWTGRTSKKTPLRSVF